jgi:ferredoxin
LIQVKYFIRLKYYRFFINGKRRLGMKHTRKIIEIDEAKCNGCGQCCLACTEGALKLVDGKAKLMGDIFCDGLGACIGECPEGALKIIDRQADEFDEKAVQAHVNKIEEENKNKALPCGCPSAAMMELKNIQCEETAPAGAPASRLGHWPVKLQLLGPQAPFLKNADLVLLADCVAVAYPDLHGKILSGKAVAIGCPKLDDIEAHIDRLAQILTEALPRSLTVVHMEVPCCSGFLYTATEAIERSGVKIPLKKIIISRRGEVLADEEL